MVLNLILKRGMELHDSFNRFGKRQVTRTVILEDNLAQHLARLAHESLFQVFMDVRKAYDSLDRERCMEIMFGYRMEQNLAHIFGHYCDKQMIVSKSG